MAFAPALLRDELKAQPLGLIPAKVTQRADGRGSVTRSAPIDLPMSGGLGTVRFSFPGAPLSPLTWRPFGSILGRVLRSAESPLGLTIEECQDGPDDQGYVRDGRDVRSGDPILRRSRCPRLVPRSAARAG